MQEKKFLTQKELAERWGVKEVTIDSWCNQKIIIPNKTLPGKKFSMAMILKIENEDLKLDEFTPFERRALKREIEELKKENETLKGIVANILSSASQVIGL